MKKNLLTLLLFAWVIVLQAQTELVLHLAPRMGNQVFQLNTTTNHPGGSGQLKFTRFEYYIAEIAITHDGGQITTVDDLYILAKPAIDSLYVLGVFDNIDNVEGISFSVGVDADHNHLDPTSYPANHPLAPQNPSMHWGWTAGYRFAAIEGVAGTNFSQLFEVHALGDANYKTVSLQTGAEQTDADTKTIHVRADYSQSLKTVNVSGGLVVHGSSGAAVTVLNNFKNNIFTASASTGVLDPAFSGAFALSPNPVTDGVPRIQASLPAGAAYRLVVCDVSGRRLADMQAPAGEAQLIELEKISVPGMYFVQLWQNGQVVAVEKMIVLN